MKKIAIVTSTRAEYGILRPVIRAIINHPRLQQFLIVTGIHLSDEFGFTIKEIERDGFKIDAEIESLLDEDSKVAMSKSVGNCILGITDALEKIKPDILLIIADVGPTLAAAICGTYMSIPIAHIHGGEVSGNVDDPVRHAITKLSHIHFAATEKSANRIIKMGEDPWRVHVVGAPGLDSILNRKLVKKERLAEELDLEISKPILLVVQHPVTEEAEQASWQMRETMEAIVELKEQAIVIYPNADPGGRRMIDVIEKYRKYPFIKIYKSLPHDLYLSLMNVATVMIGNSSSGIIEAPSFGLPAVNVGTRQLGRQRAKNIIDVDYSKREIIDGVKKAMTDKEFRDEVKKCENPYGDGKASERIIEVLSRIKINKKLIQKRLTY